MKSHAANSTIVFEGPEHPYVENIVKINSVQSSPILAQLENDLTLVGSTKGLLEAALASRHSSQTTLEK